MKNNKKQPPLKPIIDACCQFTTDDFSNIDRMNAASEKVFNIYYKQLEESKMLPFSEAERDLMKNAFRVGFVGGVDAGTVSMAKAINQHEKEMNLLHHPTKGGC